MLSICFILLLLISILTQSYGQVTCASGWVRFGDNCYLFQPAFNPRDAYPGPTYGTWDQCNAYCTTASYPGATMLCVRNAAENVGLAPQFGFGSQYWIGYTDMPPYGGGKGTKLYKWVTGCSSTYTNWAPGEPSNSGNDEDYVLVDSSNGLWMDRSSVTEQRCGCQYKLALTSTSSGPTSLPTTTPTSGVVTE